MNNYRTIPIAQIVGFDEHHVLIFCPYCGQVHYHGKASGAGIVSSHCLDKRINDPESIGYCIPSFDTYDSIKAVELLEQAKANKKLARRQRLNKFF